MEYRLSISRDGDLILDRIITADEVVQLMRPTGGVPSKPSPAEAKERSVHKGKGKGCPECGSPSRHRKDCSFAGKVKKK